MPECHQSECSFRNCPCHNAVRAKCHQCEKFIFTLPLLEFYANKFNKITVNIVFLSNQHFSWCFLLQSYKNTRTTKVENSTNFIYNTFCVNSTKITIFYNRGIRTQHIKDRIQVEGNLGFKNL